MASASLIARALNIFAIVCFSFSPIVWASENSTTKSSSANQEGEGITYWLDSTFSNKKVHVLQIDLTNPNLSVRASTSNERGLTPSEFASKTGAIAVINGDFFDGVKNTIGLAVGQGQIWPKSADTKEWSFLACDDDNDCLIDGYQKVTPPRSTWSSVVGGWQILLDPDFEWTTSQDVTCGEFCTTEHPRTAIGLNSDRTIMWWIVVEGRQGSLTGLTLADTTLVLKKLGAEWGLNMDGGGSSGLILNGRRVNGRPFNEPQERKVANCLAIVKNR